MDQFGWQPVAGRECPVAGLFLMPAS